MPSLTRDFLTGNLDEADNVSSIEKVAPGLTIKLAKQLVDNFNIQMDELSKKLLESNKETYEGVVNGIKDLQDYLRRTLRRASDPDAKEKVDLRHIPRLIDESLQDTADTIRKHALGDPAAGSDLSTIADRLDKLTTLLEGQAAAPTSRTRQAPVEARPPSEQSWLSQMFGPSPRRTRPPGQAAGTRSAPFVTTSEDPEILLWQSVSNSSIPADFEAYLSKYPDGQFASLAKNRIEYLRKRGPDSFSRSWLGGTGPIAGEFGKSAVPYAVAAATGMPELALVVRLLEDSAQDIKGVFRAVRVISEGVGTTVAGTAKTYSALKEFLDPNSHASGGFFRRLEMLLGGKAAGSFLGGLLGRGGTLAESAVGGALFGGLARTALGAIASAIKGGLAGLLAGISIKELISLAHSQGEKDPNTGEPTTSPTLSYGEAAAAGAGLGAAVGSVFPGAGTAIGAGVGAVAAVGFTALDRNLPPNDPKNIKWNQTIREWERNKSLGRDKRTFSQLIEDFNKENPPAEVPPPEEASPRPVITPEYKAGAIDREGVVPAPGTFTLVKPTPEKQQEIVEEPPVTSTAGSVPPSPRIDPILLVPMARAGQISQTTTPTAQVSPPPTAPSPPRPSLLEAMGRSLSAAVPALTGTTAAAAAQPEHPSPPTAQQPTPGIENLSRKVDKILGALDQGPQSEATPGASPAIAPQAPAEPKERATEAAEPPQTAPALPLPPASLPALPTRPLPPPDEIRRDPLNTLIPGFRKSSYDDQASEGRPAIVPAVAASIPQQEHYAISSRLDELLKYQKRQTDILEFFYKRATTGTKREVPLQEQLSEGAEPTEPQIQTPSEEQQRQEPQISPPSEGKLPDIVIPTPGSHSLIREIRESSYQRPSIESTEPPATTTQGAPALAPTFSTVSYPYAAPTGVSNEAVPTSPTTALSQGAVPEDRPSLTPQPALSAPQIGQAPQATSDGATLQSPAERFQSPLVDRTSREVQYQTLWNQLAGRHQVSQETPRADSISPIVDLGTSLIKGPSGIAGLGIRLLQDQQAPQQQELKEASLQSNYRFPTPTIQSPAPSIPVGSQQVQVPATEEEAVAQASQMMSPATQYIGSAVKNYAADVASGRVAANNLQQFSPAVPWNPELSPLENARRRALDPKGIDQAASMVLGLGNIGTKIGVETLATFPPVSYEPPRRVTSNQPSQSVVAAEAPIPTEVTSPSEVQEAGAPEPETIQITPSQAPSAQTPEVTSDQVPAAVPPVQPSTSFLGSIGSTIRSYLGDVLHGRVAQRGLEQFSAAVPYNQDVSPLQNARAMARDPRAIEQATSIALSAGPGSIRAFHGSPHSFEKFDINKIGTGEGGQVYGHGLYFSENPEVAASYKKSTLASTSPTVNVASDAIASGSDPRKALRSRFPGITKEQISEAIKEVRNLPPGRMYEVNINAEPEHFLDWDSPLSSQSERVQEALGWTPHLRSEYDSTTKAIDQAFSKPNVDPSVIDALSSRADEIVKTVDVSREATGADIIGDNVLDPTLNLAISQRLLHRGIPGVKYLDKESKGTNEGTVSYSVFNPDIVDIVRKYGIAGLLGGAGTAGAIAGTSTSASAQEFQLADGIPRAEPPDVTTTKPTESQVPDVQSEPVPGPITFPEAKSPSPAQLPEPETPYVPNRIPPISIQFPEIEQPSISRAAVPSARTPESQIPPVDLSGLSDTISTILGGGRVPQPNQQPQVPPVNLGRVPEAVSTILGARQAPQAQVPDVNLGRVPEGVNTILREGSAPSATVPEIQSKQAGPSQLPEYRPSVAPESRPIETPTTNVPEAHVSGLQPGQAPSTVPSQVEPGQTPVTIAAPLPIPTTSEARVPEVTYAHPVESKVPDLRPGAALASRVPGIPTGRAPEPQIPLLPHGQAPAWQPLDSILQRLKHDELTNLLKTQRQPLSPSDARAREFLSLPEGVPRPEEGTGLVGPGDIPQIVIPQVRSGGAPEAAPQVESGQAPQAVAPSTVPGRVPETQITTTVPPAAPSSRLPEVTYQSVPESQVQAAVPQGVPPSTLPDVTSKSVPASPVPEINLGRVPETIPTILGAENTQSTTQDPIWHRSRLDKLREEEDHSRQQWENLTPEQQRKVHEFRNTMAGGAGRTEFGTVASETSPSAAPPVTTDQNQRDSVFPSVTAQPESSVSPAAPTITPKAATGRHEDLPIIPWDPEPLKWVSDPSLKSTGAGIRATVPRPSYAPATYTGGGPTEAREPTPRSTGGGPVESREPTPGSMGGEPVTAREPAPRVTSGGPEVRREDVPVGSQAVSVAPAGVFENIARAEGTYGKSGINYDDMLGHPGGILGTPPKPISQMTVKEVMDWQGQMLHHPENTWRSTAAGAFQITRQNLRGQVERGILDPNETFGAEAQQRAASVIWKEQGSRAWEGFKANEDLRKSAIQLATSGQWATSRITESGGRAVGGGSDVSSAQAEPRVTSGGPVKSYKPDYFVGDSLSVQASKEFNARGGQAQVLATVGITPEKILSNVNEKLSQDPNAFKGKNVVLTSGSNDPSQIAQVTETVRTLKDAGANVTLGGVSQEHERISKINPELQSIAKSEGIPFAPLPSSTGDKELVHAFGKQPEFLENIKSANIAASNARAVSGGSSVESRSPDGRDTSGGAGQVESTREKSPQEKAAAAVDDLRKIAGTPRDSAALRDYLQTGGVNLDPAKQAWCAAVVNAALQQNGLEGTGSNIASMGSLWKGGDPVPLEQSQKGDLAIAMNDVRPGKTGAHQVLLTGERRENPRTGQIEYETIGRNTVNGRDGVGSRWRSDIIAMHPKEVQSKQAQDSPTDQRPSTDADSSRFPVAARAPQDSAKTPGVDYPEEAKSSGDVTAKVIEGKEAKSATVQTADTSPTPGNVFVPRTKSLNEMRFGYDEYNAGVDRKQGVAAPEAAKIPASIDTSTRTDISPSTSAEPGTTIAVPPASDLSIGTQAVSADYETPTVRARPQNTETPLIQSDLRSGGALKSITATPVSEDMPLNIETPTMSARGMESMNASLRAVSEQVGADADMAKEKSQPLSTDKQDSSMDPRGFHSFTVGDVALTFHSGEGL